MSKQVDIVETLANNVGESLSNFYNQVAMDTMSGSNKLDEMVNGKIKGYQNKTYTKYLHIPLLKISKEYNDDPEYGDGSFEGILFRIKWIKTFVPIGKEVVKEPIREKLEPHVITFRRYGMEL